MFMDASAIPSFSLQRGVKVLTIQSGSDDMNSDDKGISPPPNLISHCSEQLVIRKSMSNLQFIDVHHFSA
jgi:hypothetical protein